MEVPPGTFWYYNNWDFNVLGEAYQRYTCGADCGVESNRPSQMDCREYTAHSRTDRAGWGAGYGYLWWVASEIDGVSTVGLPAGAYSAAGNGGRWITVFPNQDLVVAIQPVEVPGQQQAQIYTDKGAYTQLLRLLFT